MKILMVCQHFWPENFRINEICRDFTADGHSVDVLCGLPNYPFGRFYDGYSFWGPRRQVYHGANVIRVGEIPQIKKLGALAITLNYFYFPLASLTRLPLLLRRRYDLVFLYSLTPVFMSFPGLVLARLKRLPAVMYVLDYWPDSLFSVIPFRSGLIRRIFAAISRWHYRRADFLITPSEGMKRKLMREHGIAEDRVSFVPQTCDALYEQTLRDEQLHERFDGRFNLVFTGNMGPAQALETLVQAAAILAGNGSGQPFRIIMVGDGMSRAAIEKLVDEENVRDCFVFEGYQPAARMPAYYELADVLLVSLAGDPLYDIMIPAKVQSYMAAGRPIFGILGGEGASVIETGRCGVVSPPGDAVAAAAAIRGLMTRPVQELDRMGQAGYAYYAEHYHHDIIKKQLGEQLQMAVQAHPGKDARHVR